ncbi:MAG: IS200/IS605 family transposase [Bacteroidota bacterium]|nr:IS200/IS605 family transposase [Bacteroidota bacterium]
MFDPNAIYLYFGYDKFYSIVICDKNMSSYNKILYHIIFSTKFREDTIVPDCEKDLYNYIWSILTNNNCKLLRIGGTANHIHILMTLHPSIALADLIKKIKVSTSLFLKNRTKFLGWQNEYGAITYHISQKNIIDKYISTQKLHHNTQTCEDEYLELTGEKISN